jgi:hypothetical protein
MCIKDYETVVGRQGPVRAVELLKLLLLLVVVVVVFCDASLN